MTSPVTHLDHRRSHLLTQLAAIRAAIADAQRGASALPTSTIDGVAWGERRQRVDVQLAVAARAITGAERQLEEPEV